MPNRNSIFALIATVFCACGLLGIGTAQAAPPLQMHECVNTGGNGTGTHGTRWSDSFCTFPPSPSGNWETTKITTLNNSFKPHITANFTLSSTVAGVKFKISCTTLEGMGEGENAKEGAVGSNIVWELGSCSVLEPSGKGCAVSSPITTNKLKFETGETTVKYMPASGETIATITISGCSVGALNGAKELKGSMVASVQEEVPGSQEFTATSGSSLKFAGQTATLLETIDTQTTNGQLVVFEKP